MQITRRNFIATAAAGAALASPLRALAEITLGDARLTTLSDGYLSFPGSFVFAGLPKEEVAKVVEPMGVSTKALTPECNVTLLQMGDRNVLFDVGSGPDFLPTAGELSANLDAAGLAPEDITDVIFTHAHPDHIWGLLDDFDEPYFPEASYRMGRAEWDYWWNPETVNTIEAARQTFAVGAKRRMEAIEDRVELFGGDEELLPGLASVSTPGHTPGHMAFELRQGSESAMILGDCVGNHHIAFARPDWELNSDQDKPMAAATRTALLDRLAQEQMTLIGFHLPGGGIGRAEREGAGYRFVPA